MQLVLYDSSTTVPGPTLFPAQIKASPMLNVNTNEPGTERFLTMQLVGRRMGGLE